MRFHNQDTATIKDLLVASARDNTNATVTAIAAPGANKAIVVHYIKISTKTADDITTQDTSAGYVDTDFLGATGSVIKKHDEYGYTLPTNKGLQLVKGTATTNLSYFIQYQIIDQ